MPNRKFSSHYRRRNATLCLFLAKLTRSTVIGTAKSILLVALSLRLWGLIGHSRRAKYALLRGPSCFLVRLRRCPLPQLNSKIGFLVFTSLSKPEGWVGQKGYLATEQQRI